MSENHKEELTWKNAPPLINCKQAAELLGVSPHTIYRWRKNGRMPSIKSGKAWLMPKEKIYEFSEAYLITTL